MNAGAGMNIPNAPGPGARISPRARGPASGRCRRPGSSRATSTGDRHHSAATASASWWIRFRLPLLIVAHGLDIDSDHC